MSLRPDQKLALLSEVVGLYGIFTNLANADTGAYPFGDDTGRAESSGQVHATRCRVILDGHTEHSSEGWYINASAMLTAMGA
jgi:hypothetical protein